MAAFQPKARDILTFRCICSRLMVNATQTGPLGSSSSADELNSTDCCFPEEPLLTLYVPVVCIPVLVVLCTAGNTLNVWILSWHCPRGLKKVLLLGLALSDTIVIWSAVPRYLNHNSAILGIDLDVPGWHFLITTFGVFAWLQYTFTYVSDWILVAFSLERLFVFRYQRTHRLHKPPGWRRAVSLIALFVIVSGLITAGELAWYYSWLAHRHEAAYSEPSWVSEWSRIQVQIDIAFPILVAFCLLGVNSWLLIYLKRQMSIGKALVAQSASSLTSNAPVDHNQKQDPTTPRQTLVTSPRTLVTSPRTPVTSRGTPVTSPRTPVTSRQTLVASRQTLLTSRETLVTSRGIPVTSRETPVTSGRPGDNLTRMLLGCVALYFLTQVPAVVLNTVTHFRPGCCAVWQPVVSTLALVNYSVNFLVYMGMSPKFRSTTLQLFKRGVRYGTFRSSRFGSSEFRHSQPQTRSGSLFSAVVFRKDRAGSHVSLTETLLMVRDSGAAQRTRSLIPTGSQWPSPGS
ncbi:hypothetical protein BV898_12362 [Hypsibius exemplaris]|uniref:G-protein coupled receptors family 1 profile domain-containing protein n=1 Tax=Hypsibius exemplaris TaxID=2072580 RepID=A0A1W0WDY2_HYPEX|nr:hypothetical protein BV898_12362 [Hypsibius exemplaris]